jgi:putative membrane protein
MQKRTSLLLALKGAAMGLAETVPGVSGGTIAFITGIYERLLESISSFGPLALNAWKQEGFAGFWRAIDGNFLLFLFSGMLLGIIGGVFGLSYLLVNFPLQVWGFFFGLIVASAIYVGKQVSSWSLSTIVILIVTALLAYGVTVATPATGSESLAYVFLCGVIAISALMLPGLSGSFMLLLLGMYQFILHDTLKEGILENRDFGAIITLGTFGLGCLLGVLTFARVLTWLFNHYHNFTLAGLTGFMIGSLNKVWPWQEVLSTRVDSKGVEKVLFSKSVLPSRFSELSDNFLYGNDAALVGVMVAMLVGFAIIFLIESSGNAATESGV